MVRQQVAKSTQQAFSRFDQLYRSILISQFFSDGWGKPDVLFRMFHERYRLVDRDECAKLAEFNDDTIKITKETKSSELHVLNGQFESPVARHFEGILQPPNDIAHFQMVSPAHTPSTQRLRPAVIHLAMTGDHYYLRRRILMCDSMAKRDKVTSVILENPYYGRRKPKNQVRSCLRNVTDLIAMGGCLMLECHVLLQWLHSLGYGPLGVTGISLGGHMASLAAGCYNKPVSLIPCLSWSTASQVWTEGVLAGSLPWDKLAQQYKQERLIEMVPENVGQYNDAFHLGRNFAKTYEQEFQDHQEPPAALLCEEKASTSGLSILQNILSQIPVRLTAHYPNLDEPSTYDAKQFMRGVMDEFTHLGNFATPLDTSLIISVLAERDAYIPRDDVTDLKALWPEAEFRYVSSAGHVQAYLLCQRYFKQAILDSLRRNALKYYGTDSWT